MTGVDLFIIIHFKINDCNFAWHVVSLLYFNDYAVFESFMNSRAFQTRIPSKRRKTSYE